MLGLPASRITVSGIPIDPLFNEPVDRGEASQALALRPDQPILLLSAGASGMESTAFMVERLLALDSKVQTVVVCGNNEALRHRISELTQDSPDRFRVVGYRDDMHRLMKMADLLIGKPGGMTSAEALASGLPLCIVNPIPGQEERNSDHLLEQGIAIKCNDLSTLAFKVDRLLNDPERLKAMRENALRFSKPRASETVVDTLLEENLPVLSLGRRRHPILESGASD